MIGMVTPVTLTAKEPVAEAGGNLSDRSLFLPTKPQSGAIASSFVETVQEVRS